MKRTDESKTAVESHFVEASGENSSPQQPDLVCFSHLRWDFVYQRPQHLLTRCARERRVFFVEEPVFGQGSMRLDVTEREDGVQVVVPHLPEGLRSEIATAAVMKDMIRRLFFENGIRRVCVLVLHADGSDLHGSLSTRSLRFTIAWMSSRLSKGRTRVCRKWREQLFQRVDLVFTGGHSLYEAKQHAHPAVYRISEQH